jgi:tetratricopeptide (TPR) repeat protein
MVPLLRTFVLAAAAATCLAGPAPAQMFSVGNGLVNDAAHELDRGRWDRGVELVQQAFRSGELMPSNVPAAYNNLCIGLTGQRKFDEAIAACNKAVDLRPREWKFYNNRANIFFYLGQFDRALAEYYKAMTFSPGDNVLMTNIGISLKYRRVYGSSPGRARDAEKAS